MLISKTKKIISFSFLTLFLIGLVVPFTSYAATTTEWYFAYGNLNDGSKATGGYQNETVCTTWRLNFIKVNADKNFGITPCKKWTGEETIIHPTATEVGFTEADLMPIQDAAKKLSVTVYPSPIRQGETSKITANLSDKKEGVLVSFSSPAEGSSLTPTKCTTDETGSCSVTFTSSKLGSFAIGAATSPAEGYTRIGTSRVYVVETITQTESNPDTDLNYYPLAPLPGIGETCEKDVNGRTICVTSGPESNGFAGYLNVMIRLFIGVCAVLAMIMIIMGGIEYMTSELVSSKQAGKERITHAILGLVLALGSYAILNTLNPDLLDVSLNKMPTAVATLMPERELKGMTTSSSGIPPSGPYGVCTEGFEQINTTGGNLWFCKKISADVKKLIDLAWMQNPQIKLFGASYRSKGDQEALRADNCGGSQNIYNESARCNPETAIPGRSRHEVGLAIDFTCEGISIQSQDNACFVWLSKNAKAYQLINYSAEPWHWSSDGH